MSFMWTSQTLSTATLSSMFMYLVFQIDYVFFLSLFCLGRRASFGAFCFWNEAGSCTGLAPSKPFGYIFAALVSFSGRPSSGKSRLNDLLIFDAVLLCVRADAASFFCRHACSSTSPVCIFTRRRPWRYWCDVDCIDVEWLYYVCGCFHGRWRQIPMTNSFVLSYFNFLGWRVFQPG